MSQSLVAEDEDVRQSCFTKSAEEPGCLDVVCPPAIAVCTASWIVIGSSL